MSNDFKPSEKLATAVNDKDLEQIRNAIVIYLLMSLGDREEIEGAVNYAKDKMSVDLFEEHDGEVFPEGKEEWDNDYASIMCRKLSDNFSQERLNYIVEINHHLYGDVIKLGKKQAEESAQTESHCGGGRLVAAAVVALGTFLAVVLLRRLL